MPMGDLAAMTTDRATAIMPAPDGSRRPSADSDLPSPSGAASGLPLAGEHPVNGAPAQPPHVAPPAGSASVAAAPVEVAERYLSPALKAAAAARARTARIRAAAWATAAGPAQAYPRRSVVEPVAPSPAAPTPGPASQPALAHELQIARIAAALMTSGGSEPRSMIPPVASAPASRGLSVAEAARASWITFHPLRRSPVRASAPVTGPRGPDEGPGAALSPTTDQPGAPTRTQVATVHAPVAPARMPVAAAAIPVATIRTPAARPPVAAARTPAAPAPTRRPVAAPLVTSAKVVTRPGGARLLPAETMRPAVPERGQRGQRFTKTIAELQRYQAATRPSEPWGNVVPRPAVPQAAPGGEADTVWSRLWSRR